LPYKYKHIIWDWNGTLMDDAWFCTEAINTILRKYNKPTVTLEKYRGIFDFPVKDYYHKLGFDFEDHPFEIVGTEFIQEYKRLWKKCSLHQDAEQVLNSISKLGLTQSVLSAADADLLDAFMNHYNVSDYFTGWLGLNHHYATSKVDLAHQFMQDHNYNPKEIMMIGDTTHDYVVAKEIGVDCILFTQGHQAENKLKTCGVPLVSSLADVLRFINDVVENVTSRRF